MFLPLRPKWFTLLLATLPLAGEPVALRVSPGTPPQQPAAAAETTPAEPAPEPAPEPAADPPAPALEKLSDLDREDTVRLQVFLDEASFGPGVIDGRAGVFTQLAVDSWNENHGHPGGGLSMVLSAAREQVAEPYGVTFVPKVVTDWVDPTLPADSKRAAQATRKRMSYRSIAEFMSERYHTDIDFLIELNGRDKINSLAPRDPLIVPNVRAFRVEDLTGARYESGQPMSDRHLVVDTRINQLRIFKAAPQALVVSEDGTPAARPNRALLASFPITPGLSKFIKFGTFEMRNCLELPFWRYDKQLLETGKRSDDALVIPPGPNCPVGILWAGLSRPGIGLHGTNSPETIGRARSAGCIRLANWDAIRLPALVRPGATVEIR